MNALGHNFWLQQRTNFWTVSFVLPSYDLQNEVSDDRGTLIVLTLLPTPPILEWREKPQTTAKSTLDYPDNMLQSAFENCESFKS